jgi:hypothetical protein
MEEEKKSSFPLLIHRLLSEQQQQQDEHHEGFMGSFNCLKAGAKAGGIYSYTRKCALFFEST